MIVVVEADHLCMAIRGLRKPGAVTTTLRCAASSRRQSVPREALELILRAGERTLSTLDLWASPPCDGRPHVPTIVLLLWAVPGPATGRWKHGLALVAAAPRSRRGGNPPGPAVSGRGARRDARIVPVVLELPRGGGDRQHRHHARTVAAASSRTCARIVNDATRRARDPTWPPCWPRRKCPGADAWRSVGAEQPQRVPAYTDVVAEELEEQLRSVDAAVRAGCTRQPDHRPGLACQDRRTQLGRCCLRCRPSSSPPASRFWWGRHASGSLVRCWPDRTAKQSSPRGPGGPPPR